MAIRSLLNVSVRVKLLGGFGTVATLAAFVGLIGATGLRRVATEMGTLQQIQSISTEFQQREIDHLVWVQRVRDAQEDASATRLGVELDETKCGFGRWIHGEGRRVAEQQIPGLVGVIARAEAPHAALHAAGRAMESRLGFDSTRVDALAVLQGEVIPQVTRLQEVLHEARAVVNEAAARATVRADGQMRKAQILMAIGGALALILVAALGLPMSHSIARPLRRLAAQADALQNGMIVPISAASRGLARGEPVVPKIEDVAGIGHVCTDEVGRVSCAVDRVIVECRDMAADFAEAVRAIQRMSDETTRLTAAARAGRLSERADLAGLAGRYRDIAAGVNDTLDAVLDPIEEAATVLDQVAQRDLTARVEGEYTGDYARIKGALNSALEHLESALAEVWTTSEEVAATADQIAGGSQDLAAGASEQAASLEEVASSLQELASMAQQSSTNAHTARSTAQAVDGLTETGAAAMQRLSATVERIKESSNATSRIVKTIDEIAFQTNLLALNAAVEAARAGEAGKGFAVVAEEVRNLAIRSAEAAQQTSRLIEESVTRSEDGVSVQGDVVAKLEGIREGVARVSEVIADIAAASEQQTQGVQQINVAVEQMNGVTQRSAASAERSASTGLELRSQAQRMKDLVGRFRLSSNATARRVDHGARTDATTGRRHARSGAAQPAHRPRAAVV